MLSQQLGVAAMVIGGAGLLVAAIGAWITSGWRATPSPRPIGARQGAAGGTAER
jgi:hypothetical protein